MSNRLYLAGPMSGIPQFNYPLFDKVATAMRKQGVDVVSPAEMDDPETRKEALASKDGVLVGGTCNGETWGDFLSRDVKLVADEVDGIVLLPGWEKSRGARLEAYVALTTQKPVYEWVGNKMMESTPKDIMREIAFHSIVRDNKKEARYG